MRASTLFGLVIAIFLGLGVVVAIRAFWTPTPPPVPLKEEPVMVLVAKQNIFEGTVALSGDVMLRKATPDEAKRIKDNPGDYLAPTVEAADLRIAARPVYAGEPLRKDHFNEQVFPKSLPERLAPGMRAVSVLVPLERSASGLIRVDEYVDVTLTTTICADPKCTVSSNATAPLATNLKVVVKRDSLWPLNVPIPPDKPASFILEANPYRAALIEFAKYRGAISLIPSTPPPKDWNSTAAGKVEAQRVAAFNKGEISISDRDLARIFHLPPPQSPEPPLATEQYSGISYVRTVVYDESRGAKNWKTDRPTSPTFNIPGQVRAPSKSGANPMLGGGGAPLPFRQANLGDDKDCPDCYKK